MTERERIVLRCFREQRDFVETRVKNGIELYRKGWRRIRVVDAEGKPVRQAQIEARQISQHFKFGANLFMLDEMESDEKNQRYRDVFPQLFNLATLPFYWIDLEPEEGKTRYDKNSPRIYRRPAIDLCMEYCEQNRIEPKLHCLNYWHPQWLAGLPTSVVKKKMLKRFREISERYADRIPMIEVTNETLREGHEIRFYEEDDYIDWSFHQAERFFPTNELIINEGYAQWNAEAAYTNRNPYFMQVQRLLRDHVPVKGLGMQFHSFDTLEREASDMYVGRTGRYNPQFLCAVLDQLGRLGLPMQITEMTIPAYRDTPADEEVQAEILRNVYSLFFAQKEMEAIIYWNLPDGYAAFAPQGDMTKGENSYRGGLLRFDLTEKPAFKMLRQLIRHDWMTPTTTLTTDDDGFVTLRGFHGEYQLTIHQGEKCMQREVNLLPGYDMTALNLQL